jgi:hypothetical protein
MFMGKARLVELSLKNRDRNCGGFSLLFCQLDPVPPPPAGGRGRMAVGVSAFPPLDQKSENWVPLVGVRKWQARAYFAWATYGVGIPDGFAALCRRGPGWANP